MKRLIVNADDFGLTGGVNRAIIECHQRGIVTSTTLMATATNSKTPSSWQSDSHPVRQTKLSASAAMSCSPMAGLCCRHRRFHLWSCRETGLFHRSIQQLAKHALTRRFRAEEIEAEATAQFRKIQAAGIRISHFDAHKHAHIFPSILRPLLRAAAACGVPALRNPFEPIFSMPIPGLLRIPVRYAEVLALRAFRAKFHSMVAESGLRTTDGSLGLVATGTLNVAKVSALLDRMQEGPGSWFAIPATTMPSLPPPAPVCGRRAKPRCRR